MGVVCNSPQPSLFSAIAIGVGCIIGSGWLFAAYYAAQYAGPASLLSWVIGACIALLLALLLAEITTMYKVRGLFSRLLSISHNNKDFGFIVAISNWLGIVIVIPSEATATVEYLASVTPDFMGELTVSNHLTPLGTLFVVLLIAVYGLINFWGIRSMSRINNVLTIFKFAIPIITGLLLIFTAFHPSNFSGYRNSFAPYGIHSAFSAVVQTGIFYAYYGFSTIALFGAELKNPRRNIPLALVGSVAICLIIYLVLQVAFIGALPPEMVSHGWHNLNFNSPLAQLLLIVNLNAWGIVLYADSALSPSGTGLVYAGSAARMLTGMSCERQMPCFFNKIHPVFNLSRRSLVCSLIFSTMVVIFFGNWQAIVVMVTAIQLIACVAVPVAFMKLRFSEPDRERGFIFRGGLIISPLIYLFVTYLMIQTGTKALITSFIINWSFFMIYAVQFYRYNIKAICRAVMSSWTMLVYMLIIIVFSFEEQYHYLSTTAFWVLLSVSSMIMLSLMIRQKNYHQSAQLPD